MAKPNNPHKFVLSYAGGIRVGGSGGVDWVMAKIEEIVEGGGHRIWVTDQPGNKIEVGPGPQFIFHQNVETVFLPTHEVIQRLRRRNYQDKENP